MAFVSPIEARPTLARENSCKSVLLTSLRFSIKSSNCRGVAPPLDPTSLTIPFIVFSKDSAIGLDKSFCDSLAILALIGAIRGSISSM